MQREDPLLGFGCGWRDQQPGGHADNDGEGGHLPKEHRCFTERTLADPGEQQTTDDNRDHQLEPVRAGRVAYGSSAIDGRQRHRRAHSRGERNNPGMERSGGEVSRHQPQQADDDDGARQRHAGGGGQRPGAIEKVSA